MIQVLPAVPALGMGTQGGVWAPRAPSQRRAEPTVASGAAPRPPAPPRAAAPPPAAPPFARLEAPGPKAARGRSAQQIYESLGRQLRPIAAVASRDPGEVHGQRVAALAPGPMEARGELDPARESAGGDLLLALLARRADLRRGGCPAERLPIRQIRRSSGLSRLGRGGQREPGDLGRNGCEAPARLCSGAPAASVCVGGP